MTGSAAIAAINFACETTFRAGYPIP